MQLNMNDEVRVTLTTYGAKVWNARYDGINIPAEHLPAPCTPGDEVKNAAVGPDARIRPRHPHGHD